MWTNINLTSKLSIVLGCVQMYWNARLTIILNAVVVFCSFVDFSKAFDRVNYWKLFNKLLDDNVAYEVVKLLSCWYSNQSVSVRWQNTQSESFGIQNGTRQGSVLSPFLFTRNIREVLSGIINSNIGCSIGGYMVNILAYADDLVLLAPSWRALQQVSNCLINCKLQLVTLICAATARKLSVWFSAQNVGLKLLHTSFLTLP